MTVPQWLTVGYQFWMPVIGGLPTIAEGDCFIWQQFGVQLKVIGSRAFGASRFMMKVRVVEATP